MLNSMLWPAFITILVFGWFLYSIMKSGNNDEKFRKEGLKVEAKIISKQHISTSGTGNMKFDFELEFMTPDGFVVTHARRFITPEEMVKIGRKNTVCLYYLPGTPEKVYLVPGDME
ncbi:hypothetical protein VU643_10755 [Klebsiella aerogenes]|uniref:hypothetical protein n=1 Tax=Klebsiella aerogenes TaxID=548 RepID=UPI003CECD45D